MLTFKKKSVYYTLLHIIFLDKLKEAQETLKDAISKLEKSLSKNEGLVKVRRDIVAM